jgi:hypothetical protein
MLRQQAFMGLLLLVAAGCQKAVVSEPADMSPHIFAALKVPGEEERDGALAQACRESAEESSWSAVLLGIPKIEDEKLRDEVAEECARTFQGNGYPEAALKVADLVSDSDRQQALRSELNSGS